MKKEAKWSDAQKQKALDMYKAGIYIPQIAIHVQKSAREVLAFLIGRGFRASILFPLDDDALLFQLYPRASWPELLARFPGRKKVQIIRRANALGVHRLAASTTRKGLPGLTCQEDYGMSDAEWNAPAKTPPRDPSKTIHPAVASLFAL